MFLFPDAEQSSLRLLEGIGPGRGSRLDLVKAIPESLRGKPFRGEAPKGMEDAVAIPVRGFGFGTWLADPVNGGEQEIVGNGGA